MTAEGAQATLGACGAGWFLIGIGLIRWTKDARGWGVLMLALGVVFMSAAAQFS